MSTLSNHWRAKDGALLSIRLAGRGQLVKMLKTPVPVGIFGPKFAYLCSTLYLLNPRHSLLLHSIKM